MTDSHDQKDVESRLWKEIQKGRYGMLGLVGGEHHQHFQPMTAYVEPDANEIWFFTRTDTDLAGQVRSQAAEAMFVIQAKDQDVQACIGGSLVQDHDRARIEKFWNPIISAWYPGGKDDPALTLLRFDCRDAQVWLSDAGPVKFAWEIVRAKTTGRMPDLGDQASVEFEQR